MNKEVSKTIKEVTNINNEVMKAINKKEKNNKFINGGIKIVIKLQE